MYIIFHILVPWLSWRRTVSFFYVKENNSPGVWASMRMDRLMVVALLALLDLAERLRGEGAVLFRVMAPRS